MPSQVVQLVLGERFLMAEGGGWWPCTHAGRAASLADSEL